jgi:hypothetical protein
MKKQVATPLINEINKKLADLSPKRQQEIFAYINYLSDLEKREKNNTNFPRSSEWDEIAASEVDYTQLDSDEGG